ncbi:MAG: lipid-A-disaccharide synthase [Pyrinomonadaceae bacterium]|nr:lipid-A-disaccharide synthase [Pyrinomonadaceae bacterium]
MKKKIKLMLVAGEVSGDSHTTELVAKLREAAPEIEFEFFGLTGEKMRETNVETVVRADDLAIIGLLEITKALPKFYKVFRQLKRAAIEKKPDAGVLVDFPDFNLPLATALKKLGFKVIYYVSPQLWAWRSYRVRNVKRDVDLLLAILPFEKKWYESRGVSHVEYIGHPLAGEVRSELTKNEFCLKHDLKSDAPIIALLPGSRGKEVTRILPPMLQAAAILYAENPQTQFLIALAATRKKSDVLEIIETARRNGVVLPDEIPILKNETREILNASDAAAVASGTATLETAFIGTPLVICYEVSWFNWNTLRHLINVPHYGLVNLIAEKRLATELIQHDLKGEKLADELKIILEPRANEKMRRDLNETVKKLGAGGASKIAAAKILEFLKTNISL